MRGTFFQKPFEYSFDISGERWKQGETIQGICTLKNHGAEDVSLKDYVLAIAFADHKKVKAKDPKAFQIVSEFPINVEAVKQTGEESIDFTMELKPNDPISENTKGMYFVCGPAENLFEGGMLELPIEPVQLISEFLELFKRFYRFELKALKNKKGFIEAKLLPPGSKELGAVEQLMLLLKLEDEKLNLKYQFKVKKLTYDTGDVKAASQKLEIESILNKNQYSAFGGSLNQEGIQKAIDEVLEQVKRKTTY